MLKLRLKKPQSAQAMVEFALVLPILLLLILGIFAFGHLFFVYSQVVSASREAARWGAAVGEAPSSNPRYMDCTSIRASAVRVGAFAGVSPDSVDIEYDEGPETNPADYPTPGGCPVGGTGPSNVGLGDRILVTVTVDYTPIVPFVNIPSFELESTTARTIIKSLPIGDAPVAEDPCVTTSSIDLTHSPATSVVGQPVTFTAVVTTGDGTTPTGTIEYSDTDGVPMGPFDLPGTGTYSFTTTFFTAAVNPDPKLISVRFESDNTCQQGSAVTDFTHEVLPATTALTIIDPLNPSMAGYPFNVSARVVPVAPGAGIITGFITITAQGFTPCVVAVTGTGESELCTFTPSSVGALTINASYATDGNYKSSIAPQVTHTVIAPTTPTILPTPSAVFTPSLAPACMTYGPIDFSTTKSLQFAVNNTNSGSIDRTLTSVDLTWEILPTAKWTEARFGAASGLGSCTASGQPASRNCLWQSATGGLDPIHQTISSSGPTNWRGFGASLSSGASKSMRLMFDHALPVGNYKVILNFGNSCSVKIEGEKLTAD